MRPRYWPEPSIRRNDSSRAGASRPSATASSSAHSGAPDSWLHPRGQSAVIVFRSANAATIRSRLT